VPPAWDGGDESLIYTARGHVREPPSRAAVPTVIPLFALAGPAPKAGAVSAVLLVAVALVARDRRRRALAMGAALVLAPVLLLADIWHSPQLAVVRHHPLAAVLAALLALGALGALALLMARRPVVLPLLSIAALPFRIPIQVGGTTSNLLVPLYLVVAAGVLAAIVPALRAQPPPGDADAVASPRAGALEWLLAASIVLYGVQACYSSDFDKALQQIAFFFVPFALLFLLLARVAWTPWLLRTSLALLVGLALVFSGIGYVEYATKHIFLNPKLLASNDLHTYFRTNSVFFDPNIYGRFLVVAMLAVAATTLLLRSASGRLVAGGTLALALLWGGLVLTLSQSSLGALLVGLATLAVLRWGARRVLVPALVVVLLAGAAVLVTPSTFGVNLHNLDSSSSGRTALLRGGGKLFEARPIGGYGSGSFEREYRRHAHPTSVDATTASHTIPVTVAAEQGIVGLAVYLALLAAAFGRLLRGAAASPARAAVAAAFLALVFHTLVYAAFLEDPLTWALLGIGSALAAAAPLRRRIPPAAETSDAPPMRGASLETA
jgi:putative inorganic carbon (HCO3(-)) transporter